MKILRFFALTTAPLALGLSIFPSNASADPDPAVPTPIADDYLSPPSEEPLVYTAPPSDEREPDENVALFPDAAANEMDQIAAAKDTFKDLPGVDGMYFDATSDTMTVLVSDHKTIGFVPGTPTVETADILKFNSTAKDGFTAKLKHSDYTRANWDRLRNDLLDNTDEWAKELPGEPGGGYFPELGTIVLTILDTDDPEGWSEAAQQRAGSRVEVQIAKTPQEGKAEESRSNDSYGRSGSWLTFSNNKHCTSGFTWKRWGSSKTYGSTAEHCKSLTFTNYGIVWGTTSYPTSYDQDTRLLSKSGSYSTYVYIGSRVTNYRKPVKTVQTSWVNGEVVAFAGGYSSGYSSSSARVASPLYRLPPGTNCGDGRDGVLMDTHVTAGGDSGGPWITANGAGDVIAHGQHFGWNACLDGGSFFMRLNPISAALGASIVVQG